MSGDGRTLVDICPRVYVRNLVARATGGGKVPFFPQPLSWIGVGLAYIVVTGDVGGKI